MGTQARGTRRSLSDIALLIMNRPLYPPVPEAIGEKKEAPHIPNYSTNSAWLLFFFHPFLFSLYARDNARVPHAPRLVKRKSARICTRKLHRLRSPSAGSSAHYRDVGLGVPYLSDSISPLPISLLSAPAAYGSVPEETARVI